MSSEKKRSIHISYQIHERSRLHAAYFKLIRLALKTDGINPEGFSILDAGCGRGELSLKLLENRFNVTGIDFDQNCIDICKRTTGLGDSFKVGSLDKVGELLDAKKIDLVVMSHVLEHMPNPINIIDGLKKENIKWFLIAVPNPIRTKIMLKYHLFGRDYSNKGHLYSWDRSHFTNFIQKYANLEIVAWSVDEVYAIPLRRIRSIFRKIGILYWLEIGILPKLLPYFSSSLIVLAKNPEYK